MFQGCLGALQRCEGCEGKGTRRGRAGSLGETGGQRATREIFPQVQTSHVVGRHWKPPGNNYQIIGQNAGDFRARGRRAKASQKQLKVQGPR